MLLRTLVTIVTISAAVKAADIAVSSGLGIDAFGIADDLSVFHKYYRNGSQWEPAKGFESMNGTARGYPPTAVSWGPGRLDYFVIGQNQGAYHKYWDGSGQWHPAGRWHEELWGKFASSLAATSWAEGRIDLVGKGVDKAYYHRYYAGDGWYPPTKEWASFGGEFSSKPATVSWAKDRLDIIGIMANGSLAHKYWDGSSWQPGVEDWELLGSGPFIGDPVITSMREGHFGIWAIHQNGTLFHKYWNEDQYSQWEDLGGNFSTAPQVVHSNPTSIDIVGQFAGNDAQYRHKYLSDWQWKPNATGWFEKGGEFASQPALVSTRPGEINILGIGTDGELYLQFWEGSQWLPSYNSYHPLGNTSRPYSHDQFNEAVVGTNELQKVLRDNGGCNN